MNFRKSLKVGLIVSGILILLLFSGILIFGLISYEGYCISFEPPERQCTFFEFLPAYLFLVILYSIIGKPVFALVFVIIILTPSIIGYLIGKRKSRAEDTDKISL